MAREIKYSELSKDFRVEDGRLFRLMRASNQFGEKGEWKEVEIKKNSVDGYCNVRWGCKIYESRRLMWGLYNECDVPIDMEVDHINRNKLDNSKENLRLADDRLQAQNKGQTERGSLIGANFDKRKGRWNSEIMVNKKKVYLGSYETGLEAHEVYMKACGVLDKPPEEIQKFFGVAQFTSKYKGVSFRKDSGKWVAYITIKSKLVHLGCFLTEEEAYQAVLNYERYLIR